MVRCHLQNWNNRTSYFYLSIMVFLLQQISLMLSCEVTAWSPKPEDSFPLTYMETMVLGDPEPSRTQGLVPLACYQNADTKRDPCVDGEIRPGDRRGVSPPPCTTKAVAETDPEDYVSSERKA